MWPSQARWKLSFQSHSEWWSSQELLSLLYPGACLQCQVFQNMCFGSLHHYLLSCHQWVLHLLWCLISKGNIKYCFIDNQLRSRSVAVVLATAHPNKSKLKNRSELLKHVVLKYSKGIKAQKLFCRYLQWQPSPLLVKVQYFLDHESSVRGTDSPSLFQVLHEMAN